MDEVRNRARFDWLVELAGAAAPGLAAGFAALKLAPSFAFDPAAGMAASGLAAFAVGVLGMRAVRPGAREHAFADLRLEPIAVDMFQGTVGEEPLLLEDLYKATEPIEDVAEGGELLLDDPLIPDPASRVVQLFASPPLPTAGQLKERIDRHLAADALHPVRHREEPAADASAALYAALAELRRSLR